MDETGATGERSGVKEGFLAAILAVGEQPMPLYSVSSMVRQPGPNLSFSHPVVLKRNPWATAVKLEPEIRRHDASGVLDNAFGVNLAVFLARYLSLCGSVRADASVFDQVWGEYELDRGRAEVPFRFQALLEGLTGQFDDLALGPRVRIKAISDEWRAERCESDWGSIQTRNLFFDLMQCEYMLEIEVDLPRGSWGSLNLPQRIADQVVTALRLSSTGGVGLGTNWLEATDPVFLQPFHSTMRMDPAPHLVNPRRWPGRAILRSCAPCSRRSRRAASTAGWSSHCAASRVPITSASLKTGSLTTGSLSRLSFCLARAPR